MYLLKEFDRLFDPYFQLQTKTYAFRPTVDVSETEEALIFYADLPGIAQEDLEIAVDGRNMTISGSRQIDKDKDYHFTERKCGDFYRKFRLPESADLTNIEAGLESGVLTLKVLKKPKVRPRKIPIKAA